MKRPWRIFRRNIRFDKPNQWHRVVGSLYADREEAIRRAKGEHWFMNGENSLRADARWQHVVRNIDTGEVAWTSEQEAKDGNG